MSRCVFLSALGVPAAVFSESREKLVPHFRPCWPRRLGCISVSLIFSAFFTGGVFCAHTVIHHDREGVDNLAVVLCGDVADRTVLLEVATPLEATTTIEEEAAAMREAQLWAARD